MRCDGSKEVWAAGCAGEPGDVGRALAVCIEGIDLSWPDEVEGVVLNERSVIVLINDYSSLSLPKKHPVKESSQTRTTASS